MKAYRISGRFRMGSTWQAYTKEVAAADEAAARERILSVLGSQHAVARKYIEIREVAEVPAGEVRDHAVRYAVEGKA
jgi:large subunit ribosomal protein LX